MYSYNFHGLVEDPGAGMKSGTHRVVPSLEAYAHWNAGKSGLDSSAVQASVTSGSRHERSITTPAIADLSGSPVTTTGTYEPSDSMIAMLPTGKVEIPEI